VKNSLFNIIFVTALLGREFVARANPTGMQVVSGAASVQMHGSQLDVTTGAATVLNWGNFNIGRGETTTFIQPSANSVVLNTIGGNSPSRIWGTLTANGTVILANAYGFYFGPNSMIKVGGNFIATTAPLPPEPGASSSWEFTGMPPLASIVNFGQIEAGNGHSLFLIAEDVNNQGTLSALAGRVGLYAGQQVFVNERPDGRGLSASVTLPSGSVENSGRIIADAGQIALNAQVVNQNGLIQANSVRNENGVISLIASDSLQLGADSDIEAQGGDSVLIKSGNNFSDTAGSKIVATGGPGANVEISAPNLLSLNTTVQGSAGGRLLLDPGNITLGTTGAGSAGDGTVGYGDGAGTLALNVNTAFTGFSSITLQATGTITLAQGTSWNLSSSTGQTSGALTLQAGGDIVFNNNSQILDANNWSVTLQAGVSFPTGAIQSGTGNIYLNGGSGSAFSGSVQTSAGSISMVAGNSILVGTGAIRTTGGGAISLTAESGDINAGTGNGGYQFSIFGYSVGATPGGIATAAGGDVSLTAGDDIISAPTVPSGQPPGASGAYGSQPGNVTLTAANQVLGNYTVANGVGTILAGVQVQAGQVATILNSSASIGSSTRPITLSLIDGSWNAWSGGDIYVAEVRNPNGTFNGGQISVPTGVFQGNIGSPSVPTRSAFLFDYGADASANFWAGDAITLAGGNVARVAGENQSMPPIYPPLLTLDAGAGGITVENPIILYPSSEGGLQITTRDGGSLTGAQEQNNLVGITMSDSGLPGYGTFAQGHALTPLHLDDPNPVTLNISGDINTFGLTVPTFADITVQGNAYNFGFLGQNLSPSQTTSINVAGNITYRGDLTSVSLPQPLPAPLFNPLLSGDPAVTALLRYDSATGTLTFIGQMTSSELSFLLSPTEVVFNADGQAESNPDGTPVTKPLTLTTAQQSAIQQLYTLTQTATLGDQGLALAGPGKFSISASSMDLGISGGISVLAPDSSIAAVTPQGADLSVNVLGDLEMTSTKIANDSLNGNINLTVGGALDVGGEFTTFGDPNAPKGVFTAGGGNVSVTANGDVNVDGSRIAAYDGGNVTVVSETGDVNAGNGGSGYVSLTGLELNPKTAQLVTTPATLPGSGIMAWTLPGTTTQLGNITIDAPRGNVDASLGGVLQIGLNGHDAGASVDINAGGDINASGSGVIGGSIRLTAGGDITGVVIGQQGVQLNSRENVAVTVFSGGNVNISASGTVSGTVVGAGTVDVSSDSITAALTGNSVAASGQTAGAAIGIPQSNVAHIDSEGQNNTGTNATQTVRHSLAENGASGRPSIPLSQKVGRVTVILPASAQSVTNHKP
jgi:filamentous hemagglutinin family protein